LPIGLDTLLFFFFLILPLYKKKHTKQPDWTKKKISNYRNAHTNFFFVIIKEFEKKNEMK